MPLNDNSQLRERLIDLVEPIVKDHGAELVDIELAGHVNRQIVRLLVHRMPNISIDLCQAIGLEVGDMLDIEDPIPGRYQLEVTSPGLARPLQSDRDFARAVDFRLKVVTHNGETLFGKLTSFSQDYLELAEKKGTLKQLQRANVAKATIEVEIESG
ncbi:MAG: ribosome maturation factor RimP [Candidatus Latescibacteria bacterium]|nr:ribosome maturation factor RimP [Candidatus Latescibacterota bacterium]